MIREIVKNTEFLQQVSERADINADKQLFDDLVDTAQANVPNCVGLAAPQIGVLKKAIVVMTNAGWKVFVNPTIIARSKETYIAVEGCLSIEGKREVKRHKWIKVAFQQPNGKTQTIQYSGFIAEIIQHECDHLRGVLI
ncbi:MAG: peptide deformylase [Clostridia bacterium]|nr:peptide deformylase [Clostridia bacterium]